MNARFCFTLVACMSIFIGCRPPTKTSSSTTDTWRLDEMAKRDQADAVFAGKVKLFYQALQNKDWPTTYDMRTATFKHDVDKSLYLRIVGDDKGWRLNWYKVLNIQMIKDPNGTHAAEIIMEFNEGGIESYHNTLWKTENGTWVCEDPGLSGPLFINMQPYDWYNH